MQVHHLQVGPGGAGLGEPPELVHDLGRRASQSVAAQSLDVPTQEGRTSRQRVPGADADDLSRRQQDRPTGYRARGSHPAEGRAGVFEGVERHVVLIGVRRGDPRCPGRPEPAHDDRDVRLRGLRQRGAVGELVVLAGKGERTVGLPQPGDDLELLLEAVEALTERREVDAVRRVLETAADPDPAKGRQAYMKLGADISPLSRREALKHLG